MLEWAPRGSLADLLNEASRNFVTLEWSESLLKLATDISRGMKYLHTRSYFDEGDNKLQTCILHRYLQKAACVICVQVLC